MEDILVPVGLFGAVALIIIGMIILSTASVTAGIIVLILGLALALATVLFICTY
jgi:hypothetical protein